MAVASALLLATLAMRPSPPPPGAAGKAPPAAAEPRRGRAAAPPRDCLGPTLCELRRRIAPRRARWTPEFCERLAQGVRASAGRHGIEPALLLAVMINESDLDEAAARTSHSPRGTARDSGLMGIRCLLDGRGRCRNALVKGMAWRQVMDPVNNVELGARYLAHYRDGRGLSCAHRNHAYWAHYNHGTRYISRGPAREYPIHVARIYEALAMVLDGRASVPTAAARREGDRYVKLSRAILAAGAVCATPHDELAAAAAAATAPSL